MKVELGPPVWAGFRKTGEREEEIACIKAQGLAHRPMVKGGTHSSSWSIDGRSGCRGYQCQAKDFWLLLAPSVSSCQGQGVISPESCDPGFRELGADRDKVAVYLKP